MKIQTAANNGVFKAQARGSMPLFFESGAKIPGLDDVLGTPVATDTCFAVYPATQQGMTFVFDEQGVKLYKTSELKIRAKPVAVGEVTHFGEYNLKAYRTRPPPPPKSLKARIEDIKRGVAANPELVSALRCATTASLSKFFARSRDPILSIVDKSGIATAEHSARRRLALRKVSKERGTSQSKIAEAMLRVLGHRKKKICYVDSQFEKALDVGGNTVKLARAYDGGQDKFTTLHNRFHLGDAVLAKLYPDVKVPKKAGCVACITGKLSKHHHPQGASRPKFKPGEKIHCDRAGPHAKDLYG
jgi:hypothetical protein